MASFPSYSTTIDTLLFDLDETLIHSRRFFLEIHFVINAMQRFYGTLPMWNFYSILKKAIKKSKTHGTDKTNHAVLVEELSKHTDQSEQAIDDIIQCHLADDFKILKKHFTPVPGAKQTIELAQELGYHLVIATNPSISLPTIKLRLEWAGVGDIPFEFITHSEVMTRCKPDPDYYREILDMCNLEAGQCLMIGNDTENDLIAREVGILTYILENPWNSRELKRFVHDPRIQGMGTHENLQKWLKNSAEKKEAA